MDTDKQIWRLSRVGKAVIFSAVVISLLFLGELSIAQTSDCTVASTAIEQASKIRGLRVKSNVPCKLRNREQVERYIRDTVRVKIPAEKIKNEERVYKLLGILPKDYRYIDGLVELYTSQLGGYYDADKNYYAMASWMPELMQMPIAVHELTHALQDQHFNLDNMLDHEHGLSDSLLARSALVEGDATAVMIDYARHSAGQGSVADEKSVSGLMLQNILGVMLSSTLRQTPAALQAMLIFPYVSGINFVHHLLRTGGYSAVDKSYKRLPQSTEEILHPEKYSIPGGDFVELDDHLPPAHVKIISKKPVYSDRMGEFMTSVLLGLWLPPQVSSSAAAGWGGDRLSLYEKPGGKLGVLVWATAWDTVEDAKEFFSAFVSAYEKRFANEPVRSGKQASFFDSFFGRVELRWDEKKVLLVIGG